MKLRALLCAFPLFALTPLAAHAQDAAASPAETPIADPPSWTGTVVLHGKDHVSLKVGRKSYDLATAGQSWPDRFAAETSGWAKKTVTVKGWLDKTKKTLVVEEFSPGDSADFVQGRVEVLAGCKGGKAKCTGIRVRGDKWVRITNARLAKRLSPFGEGSGQAAVILAGPVTRKDARGKTTWTYDANPESYWLLTRLNQPTKVRSGWLYPADTPFENVDLLGKNWRVDRSARLWALGCVPARSARIGGTKPTNNRRFLASAISRIVPDELENAVNGRGVTGLEIERNADTSGAVAAAAPATGNAGVAH